MKPQNEIHALYLELCAAGVSAMEILKAGGPAKLWQDMHGDIVPRH